MRLSVVLALLVACSSGSTTLSGAAEKGPFILGSTITVSPADGAGTVSGQAYVTQTINDQGDFELAVSADGLVSLQGDGFYYNEVTGALSSAPGTLRAFHAVSGGSDSAYINMVTHLTHDRIASLLAGGMSFDSAQQQAEQELRSALQLGGPPVDVSGDQMSLLGGDSDANAYLFAASAVVVQAGVTAAGVTAVDASIQQLANRIAADLAIDGTLTGDVSAQLVEAQRGLDTAGVKAMFAARLAAIGSSAPVPDLDRFVDTDGDAIANAVDNCPHVYNPDQADSYGFDRGDACSPAAIVVTAGDQQSGAKATALDPLTVTVTDSNGLPVAGWPVTFAVTGGDGSVAPATAVTDASGTASTVLTLGSVLEHDSVTATTGYPTVSAAVFSADTVVAFWSASQTLSVGSDVVSTPITADFNGDGLPDLAVVSLFASEVDVMTNQTPPGATTVTFGSPTVLSVGAGGLAVADVNQDGKPDLIAVTALGPDLAATVFLDTTPTNAASASFAAGVAFSSGSAMVSGQLALAIGDLNGDGKPDLILYENEYGNSPKSAAAVTALVNTTPAGAASPTFAAPVAIATPRGAGVALADVDRNGTLDVVIAENLGSLSVLSNQTTPGSTTLAFAPPIAIPLATSLSEIGTIAIGDVNGDGVSDLVLPDVGCQGPTCSIAVLVNTGPGTWVETSVDAETNSNGLASISLADIDGDGAADLVFSDGWLSTIYNATTPGSETASFSVQRDISSVMNSYGVGDFALADLNGDSSLDLIGCYESAVGVSMQR